MPKKSSNPFSLTTTELEIIRLLVESVGQEGSHRKYIAIARDRSEATVRNQLHGIYVKLGEKYNIGDYQTLALFAFKNGLVKATPSRFQNSTVD